MPPKSPTRAAQWLGLALLTAILIGSSLLFIVHAAKDELKSTNHSHLHSAADTSSASVRPQDEKLKAEKLKSILNSPVLSEFNDWSRKLRNLSYSPTATDIEKGRVLAVNRRELFKELMSLSPKSALDHAVSSEVYRRMPVTIRTHLETPVSAYGDFRVYVVMLHQDHHSPHVMTGSRIEREVKIGTSTYRAIVYGRREHITTKLNIPLQGITLDGVMVVDEEPVRRVEPSQYPALKVDRARVASGGAVAEIGGKLTYFSSPAALETFVQEQIEWEDIIGPVRPEPGEQLLAWTHGVKTVLFIRLDFSDKPGEPLDFSGQPLSIPRAQNLINNEISPFYANNSFNKTSLETTVTPVVRMPQPQSFYFNNPGALFRDAESAALAAGFDPNNFNLDIFAMGHNSGFGYGGIAFVGARGAALNGAFDLRVTAHELGHNYGLLHANLWRTTDGSTIGPGNNVEYGNPFDVMGGGFDPRAHFSAQYKRRLDWLGDANVQVIEQDGVYRVFAHDSLNPDGIRALTVRKNSDKNYWIEFRQLFSEIPPAANGAIINWDYRSRDFREIQILDMTPATNSVFDAPLPVGSVFNDDENRIRITVLGKGNTTPESLDVKVELNVGCTFSLSQTSQSFTASGGEGTVAMTAAAGCRPLATSNSSWLQPIQGDGPVRYIVAANYDSSPRTGTITVAGQTFTVEQGAATTSCATQPSGLVSWWQGEGNGLDRMGNNHGTLVKNPNFGAGKVGGGFMGDFTNRAGYAEVPDSPSLTLTKSMTIEGWLKLNSTNGWVLQRSTNSSPFLRSYDIQVFGGRIGFIVWFNSNQAAGIASDPVPLGQFVHFAATLDDSSSRVAIYINGSLVRQSTMTQRPDVATGATVKIGNVDGVTDELSIYDRALSDSEILAIYNAGNAGTGATGKCLSTSPQITIQSNPAGRSVSIDGAPPVTTPQVVNWAPGSSHTIATTSTQAGSAGTQFIWSDWSDGGAISHTVTAPAVSTTYTANFTTQFMLTTNAGTGGSVLPASGFFNSGQVVQISGQPNPGFTFNGWTGTGTGSFTGNTNPVLVTVNGPITQTAAFRQNQGPMLLLIEDAGPMTTHAVALDSVLLIRDPFPIINPASLFRLNNDRNTRLLIFVANLPLGPGEPPGAIIVSLVDSNNQTHNVAAENVWTTANSDFSQITFRLPDALPAGVCTITVKLREQSSNAGTIRIQP